MRGDYIKSQGLIHLNTLAEKSKKKESHLGDSPDHQGASTTHNISDWGGGCHPLFENISPLPEKPQKKESRLSDSPDHQGAST